jgi:hypothetical protein
MSARTDDLELNAPFHQSTPSVATSSSAGSSTKRAKEKLAQHLKGIVSDDPLVTLPSLMMKITKKIILLSKKC